MTQSKLVGGICLLGQMLRVLTVLLHGLCRVVLKWLFVAACSYLKLHIWNSQDAQSSNVSMRLSSWCLAILPAKNASKVGARTGELFMMKSEKLPDVIRSLENPPEKEDRTFSTRLVIHFDIN